jgi:type II secretion system protein C
MLGRRWPSLVSLGCLTGIAYFVASGAAALLGSAVVGAASTGGAAPARTGAGVAWARAPRDGTAILSRNPFDSAVGSLLAPERGTPAPASAEACGEKYRLISAVASVDPDESLVVIETGAKRDLYRVGARVAGDAEVVRVGWRAALLRPMAGPECWVGLFAPRVEAAQAPPQASAPAPRAASTGDPALDAALAAGVRQVGDGAYEVDRALVDRVVASPGALARTRVQPVEQDGAVVGFRLTGVRRGSLPTAIGLENGDLIHAVNDLPMTSPAGALEALQALREARHLRVQLTRRGQPRTVEIELR